MRTLNADDYATVMTGVKSKVTQKRADKNRASAAEMARRRRLATCLRAMIDGLEEQPEHGASRQQAAGGNGERRKPERGPAQRVAAAAT